ncbi:MAG: hypothetical protein AB7Q81_24530 [Gammaproteobacteria bacterium]
MAALTVLALTSAGLLDRVRGGWPTGRPTWLAHVATIAAGALMTALVTRDPLLLAAGGVLVGELSWRQDNGWRGNWVRGDRPLAWRTWRALRWGFIWAAPLVMLSMWCKPLGWYAVTAPLGALLAVMLSCVLPAMKALDLRHAWPWSELLELPVIGALTVGVLACL